ncbi:MAG: PDZ domain-containing protein [Fidelibacterota bacterium]|nr:MAG: PDZ domain-containing protein [Candidatus Neomarinimicrobiota bacterium]
MALDLSIRAASDGERGLDDVFRMLWEQYLEDGQGYTDDTFRTACDSTAGQSLEDVFQYVTTTTEIDWDPLLEPFGLLLVRGYTSPEDSTQAYYGFQTREKDGRLVVSRIDHGTPATRAGLSVHDELISIDGYRLFSDAGEKILSTRTQDMEATLVIARDGKTRTLRIRPTAPPQNMISIVRVEPPTEEQQALYSGWLQASWE